MMRTLRFLLSLVVWSLGFLLASASHAELVSVQERLDLRDAHTRVHEYVHRVPVFEPQEGIAALNDEVMDVTHVVVEKGTDINYRDQEGAWQKTDTTITVSAKPGYLFEADRQRVKVRFAPLGGFNIEYEVGGQAVHLGVKALAYFDRSSGQRHVLAAVSDVHPTFGTSPNSLVYRDAFPGADLQYVNQNTAFKQNVILKDKERLPAPASFGMDASHTFLVVVTEISVAGSDKRVWADGVSLDSVAAMESRRFEFKDNDGYTAHYFASGKAWDSAEKPRQMTVFKRVVREDGRLFLLEGLAYATLERTTFPVVIDYVQKTTGSVGHEVWDRNKTWWVSSPYTVNDGDTLVVEPGTVVKVGSSSGSNDERIVVVDGGTVKAVGEPYTPIFITAWSDDGYGEDLDSGGGEETPASGTTYYGSAFSFDAAGESPSQIQYCRIRWAEIAVDNCFTTLTTPIRDNVFADCASALRLKTDTYVQGGPEATVVNNLITDADTAIDLYCEDGEGGSQCHFTLNASCNTIAGCSTAAVSVTGPQVYDLALVLQAHDNVVVDCLYGFTGTGSLSSADSGVDIAYTGFYNVSSSHRYDGLFDGYGSDTIVENNPPFDAHTGNGKYYLRQSSSFIDAGAGSQSTYGVAEKTTNAPYHVAVSQSVSSASTWSQAGVDTGTIDLGYHHPRVDWLICDKATSTSNIVHVNADLTIDPGVVISYYRAEPVVLASIQINGQLVAVGTPEAVILWDGAGILGTTFFDSAHSLRLQANALQFAGGCNAAEAVEYCDFRHFNYPLLLWRNFTAPVKNNVFESCYRPIFLETCINDATNPMVVSNNLFLDTIESAIRSNSPGGMCLVVENNTIIHTAIGVYEAASPVRDDIYLRRNVFAFARSAAVAGWTTYPQYQNLWLDDSDTNVYWNNGWTSPSHVVTSVFTMHGTVVSATNPLLVSLPGPLSNAERWGAYLDQVGGDSSRLPILLRHVEDNSNVFNHPDNWPDGTWLVRAYAVADLAACTDTLIARATATVTVGSGSTTLSTSYSTDSTEGDLLLRIERTDGNGGAGSGATLIQLRLRNDTDLCVHLPRTGLSDLTEGESLGFWVGWDGSTFHAHSSHSGGSGWPEIVNQNARFAMVQDASGLAQASAGSSPALNKVSSGYFSEGTTSTDGTPDYAELDAGYHYGGGITQDSAAPSGSELTVSENNDYIHMPGSTLFYGQGSTGAFTLTGTMTGEANPWKIEWGAAFDEDALSMEYAGATARVYDLNDSNSVTSISTTFRDKANNSYPKSVAAAADWTAPGGYVSAPPTDEKVLAGTTTLKGKINYELGSGVRDTGFWWDTDDDLLPEPLEWLGTGSYDGTDWTRSWNTAGLADARHAIIFQATDNVNNVGAMLRVGRVVNAVTPVMSLPPCGTVSYFPYDATQVGGATCEVEFSAYDYTRLKVWAQVDGYDAAGWGTEFTYSGDAPAPGVIVWRDTYSMDAAVYDALPPGLHVVYLRCKDSANRYAGTDGECRWYIVKLPPGVDLGDGGCNCTDSF